MGSPARQILDRLAAIAVLGALAVVMSAPPTIHTGVLERARSEVAAAHHHVHQAVHHAWYDVHLGGAGVSFGAIIVVELVVTVALIALMIGWAERHSRPDLTVPAPRRAWRRCGLWPAPGLDEVPSRPGIG